MTGEGPLSGVTVIDLTRALAGPQCTALLADLGARVIKVESGEGDSTRQWPPFDGDHSLYFDSTNRGKESILIDLYSEEGKSVLDKLICDADVLVENYRLGTLDKMGYTASHLNSLNADLIHVSVTAYGETGPLKEMAGLDQVIQASSGMTSVTGPPDGPGYRVGLPVVDLASGTTAALAVASLLYGRERGHPARRGSTSLYETAVSYSTFQGHQALATGQAPSRRGNNHPSIAPYGIFPTATDPLVIAVANKQHWEKFCRLIGRPDMIHDPDFLSSRLRAFNRDRLEQLISAELGSESAEVWLSRIQDEGIPVGPVLDYQQVFESEQSIALGLSVPVRREDGSLLKVLRGPISIDGRPTPVCAAPPPLARNTQDILRDGGWSDDDIEGLIAQGIVGES